jgi:hypothetical protein
VCSSPLTALLGGGGDICLGESLDLTIFFTGAAPFTFALAENGVPQPPVTTSNNPHTVSVEPVSGTVFTLVSVSNAQGSGLAGGSASVSVFSAAPGGDCCTGHDLPRRHHFADGLRRHGISMEHGPTNRPNRGATRRYDDVRRDRFRCVCLHRHRDLDGCGGGLYEWDVFGFVGCKFSGFSKPVARRRGAANHARKRFFGYGES